MTLFARSGDPRTFRVRIWRGAGATPIVLASPCRGDDGFTAIPSAYTTKIANYVNAAMAGYPESGILYFEADPPRSAAGPTLFQVHFEFYGNAHRLKMFKPITALTSWSRLEFLVGGPIER